MPRSVNVVVVVVVVLVVCGRTRTRVVVVVLVAAVRVAAVVVIVTGAMDGWIAARFTVGGGEVGAGFGGVQIEFAFDEPRGAVSAPTLDHRQPSTTDALTREVPAP